MIEVNGDYIREWSLAWGNHNDPARLVAQHAGDRTVMTEAENEAVDAEIARRQYEEDPGAETTDCAIVVDVLREHGFHPAFEYGGLVSGQSAFERLCEQKALQPG